MYAALLLAHWPLLHLPYYWDEAGYYIPAAYDFFRSGTLIPYSTLSNAHPPLPSLYLAAWWRLFGFSPFVTRAAMCLAAAVALLGVYRLAYRALHGRRAALVVAALTAIYPVWFVQSTLAHADLLAAAGTLWALALLPPHPGASTGRFPAVAVVCFSLAALSKEIAIGTPLALAAWELWLARSKGGRSSSRSHLVTAGALLLPVLPLSAWFGFHRWRTGFAFGNPEYLRYNATGTLAPERVLLALAHRGLHLAAHLGLFVPVLVTLACLLLPRVPGRSAIEPGVRARLLVVLLANWLFFSVLGGALLTRYLLPLYPLVLLLCVSTWRQRLGRWQPMAGLAGAAFLLSLLINPPYRFAPEDTLAYRDAILLQQHAIAVIESRYGSPTVLTAWPASDALTKPELGYTRRALPVVSIDNFSYPQIRLAQARAGEEVAGQPYTVALLFSTKYEPSASIDRWLGPWGAAKQRLDERYFGLHHDLSPQAVATLLGGTIVWEEQRRGQWAAVVHFDRPQLARGPASVPPSIIGLL